jgi:hypothetical protein
MRSEFRKKVFNFDFFGTAMIFYLVLKYFLLLPRKYCHYTLMKITSLLTLAINAIVFTPNKTGPGGIAPAL